MKLLLEKDIEIDTLKIYLRLYELYKSYLLLISDNEDFGIGNVTISTPIHIDEMKTTFKSYKLFGIHKELLNQIIAEKVSSFLNAPLLLLLFFRDIKDEQVIIKPLMIFINEILNESKEKK
jgi:hypothetical protein